jgi:hypothetical protein
VSGVPDDVATLISETAILGYLELVLARHDLPDPVVSKLENVEAEALKIRDYVARMDFIRRPGE